ncbi:MAG: reverse transcriptase domain-containing protein [Patescibacteria group bacterium]
MGGGGLNSHKIFDEIISLDNLFLAWREFRKGKRNKSDVQEFEFNLEDNLFQLHQELKTKTYQHSHYIPFNICDPKPRKIHKAIVKDRVLHHAVFRILYPIFDSVDQDILLKLIKRKVNNADAVWLIERIIKSFKDGLPLGNVTSQLFANIYLDELDQFIKHNLRVKYYLRYCDDFLILGEEKYLKNLIKSINNFLINKLKLSLHPDKIIIRKYYQGIDFLGYIVLPYHRVLRTKTKKRILKKIRNNPKNLQSINSYLGILKHCRGYKIKKIIEKIYDYKRKD